MITAACSAVSSPNAAGRSPAVPSLHAPFNAPPSWLPNDPNRVPSAILAFVLPTSPLSVPRKPTADMGDDTMAQEVGRDGSGGLKILRRRPTRGSRTQRRFFPPPRSGGGVLGRV